MRGKLVGAGSGIPGSSGPLRRRQAWRPTTRDGIRALELLGVAVGLWASMAIAVALGVSGESALILEVVFLAVPVVCAFASAIGAGVLAILALVHGERALLVGLPLVVAAFALMFVIGELAVPH